MAPSLSPLAPKGLPDLPPVGGVRLAAGNTGTRYKGRDDVLLVELAPETAVAGVFTRSRTASGPVDWCRRSLEGGVARALVVNAGNANAFTGARGEAVVETTAKAAAKLVGCRPEQVFIASTGVIGQVLPPDAIAKSLAGLHAGLRPDRWDAAARAIMTTDTFPKAVTRTAMVGGKQVRITGIAKGSGMIAPDMATMLAFVFTDAAVDQSTLQRMLARGTERSFNAITVDSDTSTSDTLLLCAAGAAGNELIADASAPAARDFRGKLEEVLLDLAHQVVRDGEGATKFVTVDVVGATSPRSAKRVALAIANSPLVKTAIAGEDANWGRIVMAVGKSGEPCDRDKLGISVGGTLIAAEGMAVEGYDETPVADHMKGQEIHIEANLNLGRGKARVWTCDLTHGYIDINGSYRS
jgi:glutamate N-acetyltransferase/amino-acid N-acetyltransferase